MYKYKNGLLPKSFDDMFENFESIYNYDTQHKMNYRPQNHKIKTILCSGPKVWNTLPKNIQNASNIKNFKQQFCNYYQEWLLWTLLCLQVFTWRCSLDKSSWAPCIL